MQVFKLNIDNITNIKKYQVLLKTIKIQIKSNLCVQNNYNRRSRLRDVEAGGVL